MRKDNNIGEREGVTLVYVRGKKIGNIYVTNSPYEIEFMSVLLYVQLKMRFAYLSWDVGLKNPHLYYSMSLIPFAFLFLFSPKIIIRLDNASKLLYSYLCDCFMQLIF